MNELKFGVLTKREIKELQIISKKSEEKLYQLSSYDLRLGECAVLCENNSKKKNDKNSKEINTVTEIDIKPFSTILFSTYETIKLPNNVVGRFDLRVKHAVKGLFLQVGTQVEPCTNGKLYGLLLNFSNETIHLREEDQLFTIEFHYLNEPVECVSKPEESISDFYNRNKIQPVSMQSLIDEIKNNLEKKIKQDRTERFYKSLSLVSILSAFFIPFICIYLTKATIDKDDYPFDRIIRIEDKINKYDSIYYNLENKTANSISNKSK